MQLLNRGRGVLRLYASYSPQLVKLCKEIPGLVWDGQAWSGYADAMLELEGKLPSDWPRLQWPPDPDDYQSTQWGKRTQDLRGYQREGVEFLASRAESGVLLADAMGLGKSATAVRAASLIGDKLVVVCPSYVRGVWMRELGKWWVGPQPPIAELWGTTPEELLLEAQVALVHYDVLYAWVEALKAWGPSTIILDEAHFISSEKARRSKAAKDLARHCHYRIGLSGTPMLNRPKDLWNVVDTLSPGRFGKFFRYALRHCNATQTTVGFGEGQRTVWDFSGRSNLEELQRRLVTMMLRRTYTDVQLEMPPKTRQVVELRAPSEAAKLEEVVKMVRQHVEDGHKVVVFGYKRETVEVLAARLSQKGCPATFVHGGQGLKKRLDEVSLVASSENLMVLVATIDSLGVGVDLTFANVCVFAELSWEPTDLEQAEGRVWRSGQGKHVVIQYVVQLGTTDEQISSAVVSKLGGLDTVLGKSDTLKEDLQRGAQEDLKNLLEAL